MLTRSRCIAALLTAVTALSGAAGASAATKTHGAVAVKQVKKKQAVAAISAFPTGGKGSGTEATCNLWSQRLQEDQQLVNDAPEADKDDASGPLNKDVDNAMDAGCAVIL